ncbi:MAG: MoaD family protein [Candidatus Odinarchaeota archaeon]|nr:MoaD family protein [Candidatus Odinarchaeota archaeon]
MSTVTVKLFANLRELAGTRELKVEASTIEEVLKKLIEKFGESFRKELFAEENKIRDEYLLLLNGKNFEFLDGLKTKLKDNDVIAILPPVGGG